MKNLFGVVILSGAYSFFMATLLVALDAVDVAMTEAAVGAGVSTVLLLSALHLVRTEAVKERQQSALPIVLCLIVGGALIYGTWDLPKFGSAESPVHSRVSERYIQEAYKDSQEMGIPNIVTAVLASYRGFDTWGETTVVFAAGLGVMILLRGRRRDDDGPPPPKPMGAAQPPEREGQS